MNYKHSHFNKLLRQGFLSMLWFLAHAARVEQIHAEETRSLEGWIALDVGIASDDLQIDVTVRNHSFVFIPPATILRPVTSTRSRRIVLSQGQSEVFYQIDDILLSAADYSIEFNCVACEASFRRQFYSEGGNRFGLSSSAYLDPQNLGPVLDATIVTDVQLSGSINFINGDVADRDLSYEMLVTGSVNTSTLYAQKNFQLSAGQSSIDYRVAGLQRMIGEDSYALTLRCTNCFARSARPLIFERSLSPEENHSNINFLVSDTPAVIMAPILDLLSKN